MEIKLANKIRLAKYIRDTTGTSVNPHSLFDIQVKRIHEVCILGIYYLMMMGHADTHSLFLSTNVNR